jgi:adenine-specific DNA-methyltransferase
MPRKKNTSSAKKPTQVEAVRHQDKRTNIPTREEGGLVGSDEATPATVRYKRDPSLDPQLVWKGKDEQDAADLEVPAPPIYIQEKIQPQVIIDDVRQRASRRKPDVSDLFSDFNGGNGDPAQRTEFYLHDRHWTNRLILGDSLYVMNSLAEKERLKGRVQMIYIDPPYGIKFGSNWQVSTRKRDVKDAKAEDLTRQPEQVKAFRDTWELGIHSYLTYLRDRLTVARELLTESGSVFVQIADENIHLIRSVLDEVFGSENCCGVISFWKTSTSTRELLPTVTDYHLWYSRSKVAVKFRQPFFPRELGAEGASQYTWAETNSATEVRRLTKEEIANPNQIPQEWRVFSAGDMTSSHHSPSAPVQLNGVTYQPSTNRYWSTSKDGIERPKAAGRLMGIGKSLMYKRYQEDFPWIPVTNIWRDTLMTGFTEGKIYVVQTSVKVIERCLLMTTDPGDLVLDPTCGSGTTAYVAEQWGRRWITIDTSRVALALTRSRLMAAKFPYYLLKDSPAGRRKEMEVGSTAGFLTGEAQTGKKTGKNAGGTSSAPDIRKGFVYKQVPHVTLKSIANNPDIKEGMTREQIDAAIRKYAETETLYDQPYEDKDIIRVSGPFTVESLSPHRMLPGSTADIPAGEADTGKKTGGTSPRTAGFPTGEGGTGTPRTAGILAGKSQTGRNAGVGSTGTAAGTNQTGKNAGATPSDFVHAILDNLRKAGVQNTKKGERLTFDRLDIYPGEHLHAEGTYTENGKSKRVAVCIGPEFGTVGPEHLTGAALEASRGLPYDLLLLCGFAFDPHVAPDSLVVEKRMGKLRVLLVRMNPDLAMGDKLLKKTGAGNLIMVFGEPDIVLEKAKDGKLTIEVKGVDVFDPTTGEIRSSGPDDIACWFIDTDYNGESFFVRHAYFLGGNDPYEKLKRALKAEIDEGEWAKLYSARSVPFDPPKNGKIAVKVINHYGDEVLKVYPAGR